MSARFLFSKSILIVVAQVVVLKDKIVTKITKADIFLLFFVFLPSLKMVRFCLEKMIYYRFKKPIIIFFAFQCFLLQLSEFPWGFLVCNHFLVHSNHLVQCFSTTGTWRPSYRDLKWFWNFIMYENRQEQDANFLIYIVGIVIGYCFVANGQQTHFPFQCKLWVKH